MERQLLWNCIPDPKEDAGRWYFYIVNELREIGRIKSKIFSQFSPTRDIIERMGKIENLKYELLIFYSQKNQDTINFNFLYQGKTKRERRLDEDREDGIDGLEASITNSLIKGTL